MSLMQMIPPLISGTTDMAAGLIKPAVGAIVAPQYGEAYGRVVEDMKTRAGHVEEANRNQLVTGHQNVQNMLAGSRSAINWDPNAHYGLFGSTDASGKAIAGPAAVGTAQDTARKVWDAQSTAIDRIMAQGADALSAYSSTMNEAISGVGKGVGREIASYTESMKESVEQMENQQVVDPNTGMSRPLTTAEKRANHFEMLQTTGDFAGNLVHQAAETVAGLKTKLAEGEAALRTQFATTEYTARRDQAMAALESGKLVTEQVRLTEDDVQMLDAEARNYEHMHAIESIQDRSNSLAMWAMISQYEMAGLGSVANLYMGIGADISDTLSSATATLQNMQNYSVAQEGTAVQ